MNTYEFMNEVIRNYCMNLYTIIKKCYQKSIIESDDLTFRQ